MSVKQEGLKIEYVPLEEISRWPRNPRRHSEDLESSIVRWGFIVPMVVDEGSGKLVAGHGRLEKLIKLRDKGEDPPQGIKVDKNSWLAPVVKGVYFDNSEDAEAFLLSDNLLSSFGWEIPDLKEMLDEGLDVIGIDSIEDLESTVNKTSTENSIREREEAESDGEEEEREKKLSDQQIYDQLPFELEGVMELSTEAYFPPEDDDFSGSCIAEVIEDSAVLGVNRWGIPNLRPDALVEELPKDLKIWGDRFSTPDDGFSWYLFNYGAVKHKGLPFDRSIFSFYTHDDKIESWWMNPKYRVGQIIVAGVRMIVVPDYSLWDFAPVVLKLFSIYRAAWLGRYFQETRMMKVIPRLEYFMEDAKIFSLAGIPVEAPVLSLQMQTTFDEDRVPEFQKNLETAVNKIFKPKQLLVVVSKRGREILNDTSLNCEVVALEAASIARKSEKETETNPYLLQFRKEGKRGMKEGSKITTPNK